MIPWAECIGRISGKRKNEIKTEKIQRFAEAVNFPEVTAGGTSNVLLAPPTFPRTLEYGSIHSFSLPKAGMIHGKQSYCYDRPLYSGDVIYCCFQLQDIVKKQGKSGEMLFVYIKQTGEDVSQNRVFYGDRLLILPETLWRKEAGGE
ncbi:MaoC family dehydratase N-terminal domain-containing protein [Alteribacillus sp. HJP-4]|uniref:FAS1-like dehydratase domain-containing protein n=1 Tax=Alteribacillus sp. HJP-4 TaxID=2775394 RepID=UPI0035CCF6F9